MRGVLHQALPYLEKICILSDEGTVASIANSKGRVLGVTWLIGFYMEGRVCWNLQDITITITITIIITNVPTMSLGS